jgi:hypothetical protein
VHEATNAYFPEDPNQRHVSYAQVLSASLITTVRIL